MTAGKVKSIEKAQNASEAILAGTCVLRGNLIRQRLSPPLPLPWFYK